jgi:hypothetical protein
VRRYAVMMLCSIFLIAAGCQAAEAGTATSGGSAPPSTGWGTSEPVPGLAALTIAQGNSGINAISCTGPGNCTAGGFYQANPSGRSEGFVVRQVNGTWGNAEPVPGLAALNQGGAQVSSISCPSRGNCAATGYYTKSISSGGASFTAGFVVSQVNGTWGQATEIPGLTAYYQGHPLAQSSTISCGSAGNCVAGGYQWVTVANRNHMQAFLVSQVNGVWGKARAVTGAGPITSVSCPSAGNCTAVGGRVLAEVNGTWGKAIQLKVNGVAAVLSSVTCTTAGNCVAVGKLGSAAGLATQTAGSWGGLHSVEGTAVLKKGQGAIFTSISCAKTGLCTAAGYAYRSMEEGSSTREYAAGFLITSGTSHWSSPQLIPGMSALSKDGYNVVTAASCSLPVNCAVGGAFSISPYNPDGSGPGQAFVASKVGGKWDKALDVTTSLGNQGPPQISAMSCPRVKKCTAGGIYYLDYGQQQAFVVSQAGS